MAYRAKFSDAVKLFLLVCGIHYFFIHFIVLTARPHISVFQPFRFLPSYIFVGWDSGYLFQLARHYDTPIWPPLYPFLLRCLNSLFPHVGMIGVSLLLNLLCQFGIILGLLRYGESRQLDRGTTLFLPLFTLFYPGHNVFFAAYTECLYLVTSVWAVVYYFEKRYVRAGLFVILAVLSRNTGGFLVIALALTEFWKALRSRKISWGAIGFVVCGLLAWGLWLYLPGKVLGISTFHAADAWQNDVIASLKAQGIDLWHWFHRYLFFSFNNACLFYWIMTISAVVLALWGMVFEWLYVISVNASALVIFHRPFAWSRFVAVLFPWNLAFLLPLKRHPKWRLLLLILFILVSYRVQSRLFAHLLGEP